MVKKLSGYFLIGLGLLGFLYFKSYKGNTIPLPILWLVLSIIIVLIGTFLTVTAKTKKQIQILNQNSDKINRLKDKGERILIDLDDCDFITAEVNQSNPENFSRVQIIDALYDPNRNHLENNSRVTYIVYKHKNGDNRERFVSQPYSMDDITLKYYTSKNKVVLYVDKFDRTQYFFNVE